MSTSDTNNLPVAATSVPRSIDAGNAAAPPRRPLFQFGLRALLIGMTLGGIVFGLLGIQMLRRSREARAFNNLNLLGLALHTYHDTHGGLPAPANYDSAEKPLLKWRVHILPFLGHKDLYQKFKLDEAWDSLHNRALIAQMPKEYESPITDSKVRVPPGSTCYLAIVGDNTMFPHKPPAALQSAIPPVGIRLLDALDGTSNTIMVVEAAPESAVIWTRPNDFATSRNQSLVGHRAGGFLALLGDGSVRLIPQDVTDENLRWMFLRNDGHPLHLWDY